MRNATFLLITALLQLLIYSNSYSQPKAIFGENDTYYIDGKTAIVELQDSDKEVFFNNFVNDFVSKRELETIGNLINPPAWGKTISDSTSGIIKYHRIFQGGWVCDLSMKNLFPYHKYILTINGNPDLQGNELLPDTVPNYNIEKYYDFQFITTDKNGNYNLKFGLYLNPGVYDVRFYVKDTEDFKIVLYRDYFLFTVE
jgi:hypothetical protein